jgi:hypothetical protein
VTWEPPSGCLGAEWDLLLVGYGGPSVIAPWPQATVGLVKITWCHPCRFGFNGAEESAIQTQTPDCVAEDWAGSSEDVLGRCVSGYFLNCCRGKWRVGHISSRGSRVEEWGMW